MNILHYSLGLPPYRSGGLTKYATDLMLGQSKNGHVVSLLYPGEFTFWRLPVINLKAKKNWHFLKIYEIKNPPPVPLFHGVKSPKDIINHQKLTEKELIDFFNNTKPEILHIHTLMGLPEELVVFFKKQGVKIIFSTHDYYGLCPKVNFINDKDILCNDPTGKNCSVCNANSPSSLFLKLRNSNYLLRLKNWILAKKIKNRSILNAGLKKLVPSKLSASSYNELLEAYKRIFNLIDCFHFNSSITSEVFQKFISPKQFFILPITHADIHDNRKLRKIEKKLIRIAFIGSMDIYKGFPMLKEVLHDLYTDQITNWTLEVWGNGVGESLDYNIHFKGKYTSIQLNEVFKSIDLLIVPSVWKETFSLITLEALSFGVPVLVSNNVGAKDLIKMYDPEFIADPNKDDLKLKIKRILSNPDLLDNFNKKILESRFDYSFKNHLKDIDNLYLSCLAKK